MPRAAMRWVMLPALLIPAASLSGCHSWHRSPGPVPEVVAREHQHRMRFTLDDSSRVSLERVTVVADSVEGLAIKGEDTSSVRIPQARITAVEVRRASANKTGAVVLLSLAVATAAGLVIGVFIALSSNN